ncbi:hypothetical protein [Burkholderia sp. BCC1640]|uniref:hypothetical protein n=1 Tax=Burkholderia sp. BCC1640 TaxID=2676294 RepID=UPI001FC81E69|nr:hypothetical protein [Burkholderia sp. BCC1640]
MGSLINLPGVAGGRIDNVPFFNSPAHAVRLLLQHRACTDAGDYGAVSIWRTDDGKWNCLFSRRHVDIEHSTFEYKKDVRAWLDIWHPKIDNSTDPRVAGGPNAHA